MTLTKLLTDEDALRLLKGETIEIIPAKTGYRIVFDGKNTTDKGVVVGYHYEPVDEDDQP